MLQESMFYLGTFHCYVCTKPHQKIWSGCVITHIDTLCDDCVAKIWNADLSVLDEIQENYTNRIQEMESELPPEIGPARQSMKREIISLLEIFSLLFQGRDNVEI